MSLENIERMMRHLQPAIDSGLISGIEFIWHGGEPFLIPLDYYRTIGDFQRAIFADPKSYENIVQTNLTILTDRHIEFLREREFFHHMGVSFDVFGDQRVDILGALRNDIIMINLEKLIQNEIPFGSISVLSRDTIGHAQQVQKFWEALGKNFRLLPFHLSIDDAQSEKHGLSGQEQVRVLNQCFLDWLASPKPVRIYPISEYLDYALGYMACAAKSIYEPAAKEIIYVANVDGSISGVGQGELYDTDLSYGNIFTTPFADILASASRKKAGVQAVARMEKHCTTCPYFGYCPGNAVAHASREDLAVIERDGCTVRRVVSFMVDTLNKSDLAADLRMPLNSRADGDAADSASLAHALL
jgi:uncharacterized protein